MFLNRFVDLRQLYLPAVQAGNLRVLVHVLVFSELRESCWSCCSAVWLWWSCPQSQQRSAAITEQRTTSKLGMKTI